MSEEEVRALAVEEVKRHLELSDKTRVKLSLTTAISICATIIAATWFVGGYLNRIQAGQDRIELGLSYKISREQFAEWARQLDRMNRGTVPALVVPEVPSVAQTGK